MISITIENCILKTLAYTDQFDFPLTADELWQRLISDTTDEKSSKENFRQALQKLVDQKKIIKKKNKFVLHGRESIFALHQRRAQVAQQKWEEVGEFLRQTSFIPWVDAIFVTGSLAMSNTDDADDLDFMIVTAPNCLWLVRICFLFVASIVGKRRSWQEKTHRGWCLNLWVDENHLAVDVNKRGAYQAYEVMQAKPILNRKKTVENFYAANSWVENFLPNWKLSIKVGRTTQQEKEKNFFQSFFYFLDFLVWKAQVWYMRPHQTTEQVGRGFAFFHPRNTEQLVQKRWQTSLSSVKQKQGAVQLQSMLPEDVRLFVESVHQKKQSIVFVSGVFDILHQEHENFLRKAKSIGDVLLVAIESDARVRKMKGEGRPIHPQLVRKENLEKLGVADKVFILPMDFSRPEHHDQLIREIRPAFLAISSHTAHQIEKKKIVEKYGGELRVVHEYNPAVSTTKILESR